MRILTRPWGEMNYQVDGAAGGPIVLFANSLGTDLRLWDAVLPLLPQGLRYVRYDKRGHGLSDIGPVGRIADYADDAAALIGALGAAPVVFVGLSIGGLIAQTLAAQRPELVCALVLSNTAPRLGTAESWQARIEAVNRDGLASIADGVLERWFAPAFRASAALALWRNMMIRTPTEGYIAACKALAAADQTEATSSLRLPALLIGGSEDGASPPAQVQATAALIAGSRCHIIPDAGHLPCVETPEAWAAVVSPFLKEHAHA